MTADDYLNAAKASLRQARDLTQAEIRAYPTPISGCDAQYNHLIGQRGAITDALRALEDPPFVATPRMLSPQDRIESR